MLGLWKRKEPLRSADVPRKRSADVPRKRSADVPRSTDVPRDRSPADMPRSTDQPRLTRSTDVPRRLDLEVLYLMPTVCPGTTGGSVTLISVHEKARADSGKDRVDISSIHRTS